MDENIIWHRQKQIANVAENLIRNTFSAYALSTRDEAQKKVLELITPTESVAFGGSQTLQELGIRDLLAQRGQPLIEGRPGMPPEESIKVRRKALTADVFMASPNAITRKGDLFFVDKIGNRAAGVMFGPAKVIIIAGFNKIVDDQEAAVSRVAHVAAPINTKRLKCPTPCATTGECADCSSPKRICNIYVTLRKRPSYTDYHVILLPEDLGY